MQRKTFSQQSAELAKAIQKHPYWDAEYYPDRPPRAWHTTTTHLITYNTTLQKWSSPLGRYPTAQQAVEAINHHYQETRKP